jgi:hypothetical protein
MAPGAVDFAAADGTARPFMRDTAADVGVEAAALPAA